MLIRRALVAAILALGGSSLIAPSAAYADYEHCDALGNCYWVVENPGTGGGGNGGGGNNGGGGGAGQGCSYEGQTVPCVVDGLGVWDGSCYVSRVPPPPGGRTDGYWSIRTCGVYGGVASQTPATWSADPPAGILPSYQELAQRAIAQMNLDGPSIGIAPQTNGAGLVGLPIWLWNTVSPSTWGPITRTAAVPGRSVTATARAQKIGWNMGDGNSLTCTEPGTAYQPSYGNKMSPDCGYAGYARPSSTQPGGRYTVTATTSWLVTWSGGGGNTGSQTVDLSSTTTIDIDELQVITS
ncbi:hypothetical protein OHQ88_14285 [Micromonospora zamorensis]|uniref:hypothetical protein n=1 Tax=Micromonospora zamorensis TaxID=709883 RepID=UPI002E1EC5E2